MPKEYEYNECPKARENFERGMKALFQVPKDGTPRAKKTKKKLANKPANPALPAILAARLKTSPASSLRASQEAHGQ
jgi:hypothetical protein